MNTSANSTRNPIAATLAETAKSISRNDSQEDLVDLSSSQGEIAVSPKGVVYAKTGKFTGRSAKDKYIVADAMTRDTVWWENSNAMTPAQFDALMADMLEYARGKELYEQDLFGGADPKYRFDVEVFSESPWHSLFIRHLLIRPTADELKGFAPNVTILHMPGFQADPDKHGTRTETCIALDFSRNTVLICGTYYAGEIKKSVFSLFNYHAPDMDVFPMHCSANVGEQGDTTLFFGLSGTGKTTLSTDPHRALVGDDEHGWSKDGVFNLEGGCYAKAIKLTPETEPEIHNASRQYASVLENVTFHPETFDPDFDDDSTTENTRIAYPLEAIANRVETGAAGRRCLWRFAARCQAEPRSGDFLLPVRLHSQTGRHRTWRYKPRGNLLSLFRCTLHVAAPLRIRSDARGAS
jgi:phosphoenolpyruvate carboxykinase (ATP)